MENRGVPRHIAIILDGNGRWAKKRMLPRNAGHAAGSKNVEDIEKGLDKEINEFFILGQKYKKGIFSHNTALYFYDLTDRTPIRIDMTFPSYITVHDKSIKVHYIKKEKHLLGLKEMRLQDGTTIQIYDMERTICDIIRDRNKIDPQIFNDAIKGYIKKKEKNLILLYEYAEKFKIQNILKNYMEVL